MTARYASEWLTETKKLRFKYTEKNWREEGANWWKDTTEIWQSRNYQLEKTENKVLSTMLKDQGKKLIEKLNFFVTNKMMTSKFLQSKNFWFEPFFEKYKIFFCWFFIQF